MKQVILNETPKNTILASEVNCKKFHCLTVDNRLYLLNGRFDFRRDGGNSYAGISSNLENLIRDCLKDDPTDNKVYEFDSPLELAEFIVRFHKS